jgi:hypothetical protein
VIVYTSTATSAADLAEIRGNKMGILYAATASRWLPTKAAKGIPIALDNGAFSCWARGHGWDELSFLNLIRAVIRAGLAKEVRWIVAPDIVMGGKDSLEKSLHWARYHLDGWPLLLAVQNGMEPRDVAPLMKHFAGVFVGGDLEWKWTTARAWCDFAHERGKLCHIGRAGESEDLWRARQVGADSADSSSFIRNKTFYKVARYMSDEPDPDFLDMEDERHE